MLSLDPRDIKGSSKAIASRMRGMSPTRRSVGGPAPVVSLSCSISILENLRLSGIPSPWKCSASYKYKLYTIYIHMYIYICTVHITILTGFLSQLVGVWAYNHGYTLNCNPPFSNQPVSPLDVWMRRSPKGPKGPKWAMVMVSLFVSCSRMKKEGHQIHGQTLF